MSALTKVIIDMVYVGLEKFGRFYSEYRGFVTDNADPQGMGRIQVVVPGIIDNSTEEWIYPSGVFGGMNYGCQVLPQKGDVVFITFEMGDPNRPLWKHGYFGEGEIPKELRSPNLFWFKTPKGLLIELDDDKKEMRLTDTFGNKLSLTKEGISVDTEKKVFLASTGPEKDNSVALGNETAEVLESHSKGIMGAMKSISKVSKTLQSFTTQIGAAMTPAGMLAVAAKSAISIARDLKENADLDTATNESITNSSKKIPKVKSKKVIINE